MTVFTKHSISDVWQGSECASVLLTLFFHGSKRDTRELLIYAKLIMVFAPKFSSYSEATHGGTTIRLTKG